MGFTRRKADECTTTTTSDGTTMDKNFSHKKMSALRSSTSTAATPSRFQVWKLASRPHTLTASVAPVLVGSALTLHYYVPSSLPRNEASVLLVAVPFAIFACLIQIATNLHNDYADFVQGADTAQRVGQARATQMGWLTPYETCRGCVLCLMGAFGIGVGFLIKPWGNHCVSRDGHDNNIYHSYYGYEPVMVFVVASSLFNAVTYTGGPFPLGYLHSSLGKISIGYSGLGDLFVFLYFGIVATMGVPYLYLTKVECRALIYPIYREEFWNVHEHSSSDVMAGDILFPVPLKWLDLQTSFLHSLPIGFLATAIIVVNNLRDRHTDICAGKKTLAVRLGERFTRGEYLILIVGSYIFCLYITFLERRWTALLPFLSLPMAIPQLEAVALGGKDGQRLNEHVGGTARLQMVYCILLSLGLILSER